MISQTEVWRILLCCFTSFPCCSWTTYVMGKGDKRWLRGLNRVWKPSCLLTKSEWTRDGIAQLCIITTVFRSGYFCKCNPYAWLWCPWCKVLQYVLYYSEYVWTAESWKIKQIQLKLTTVRATVWSWFKINSFSSLFCCIDREVG